MTGVQTCALPIFAKRQRELAKKAKKEEKQQRKAATGAVEEGESTETELPAETPAEVKPAP